MKCQWQELLNLLPVWLRKPVDEQGREDLQELRLRRNAPAQLIKKDGSVWLQRHIGAEDISFCINAATRYSPWTAGSISQGYITALGGHRIGICGEGVLRGDDLKTISTVTSLCIRVARDIRGVYSSDVSGFDSVLIIGSPGSGKTTLLRDMIRTVSNLGNGAVAVIDERKELFPCFAGNYCFERGKQTDVLSGCRKSSAIEMVLRTMGPAVIAVDEITAGEDCDALYNAAWCGVRLLATAHAADKRDLYERKIYQKLVSRGLFQRLIVMRPDKSFVEEVIPSCC